MAGIVVHPPRKFHRQLLGLLGRTRREVLDGHAPPDIVVSGEGGAERLGWIESARDEHGRLRLVFLVRLFDEVVWAVGVHSSRYHFTAEPNEGGKPYLVAVPKGPDHNDMTVNWIVEKSGRVIDLGVGY